jgi:cob(I)alamin adenosyltransferase
VPTSKRTSARVTTRTGDTGETSLFGKERVRKTDPRIEALGELDEAQSVIGVARSLASTSSMGRELLELQRGLYLAMSEVATPQEDLERLPQRLDAVAIDRLDRLIEIVRKMSPIEGQFVVPGEDPISAALDHARTVSRRAERRVVECVVAGLVPGDLLIPWLNRLSDVLFVLARSVEKSATRASTAGRGNTAGRAKTAGPATAARAKTTTRSARRTTR